MSGKVSLEEQVATLQKQFGGIVKLVKGLKASVEALESTGIPKEMDEVKEILEAQRVIDEIIVANADAIKRMDREMKEIKEKKQEQKAPIDTPENEIGDGDGEVKTVKKKCRYFNRGFCKYKTKCRFVHPKQICQQHTKDNKCEKRYCQDRHPKTCKWLSTEFGCKRSDCEYLHVTLVTDEVQVQVENFKCVSCMYTWMEKDCVVKHTIKNQQVYFCLNCNDWVKNKERVFDQGWTMDITG